MTRPRLSADLCSGSGRRVVVADSQEASGHGTCPDCGRTDLGLVDFGYADWNELYASWEHMDRIERTAAIPPHRTRTR